MKDNMIYQSLSVKRYKIVKQSALPLNPLKGTLNIVKFIATKMLSLSGQYLGRKIFIIKYQVPFRGFRGKTDRVKKRNRNRVEK